MRTSALGYALQRRRAVIALFAAYGQQKLHRRLQAKIALRDKVSRDQVARAVVSSHLRRNVRMRWPEGFEGKVCLRMAWPGNQWVRP